MTVDSLPVDSLPVWEFGSPGLTTDIEVHQEVLSSNR